MAGTVTGVFPCYMNQFKVGATAESVTAIADMDSFSVSFDNSVEEWKPYDQEGWVRRLMTGKGFTIEVSGKRNLGDTGNDFIAGMFMKNGRDAECVVVWTFPDGAKLTINDAIISVTNCGSGNSTDVGPLTFTIMSNGKPTYQGATA